MGLALGVKLEVRVGVSRHMPLLTLALTLTS
jgi:hypothetical protein